MFDIRTIGQPSVEGDGIAQCFWRAITILDFVLIPDTLSSLSSLDSTGHADQNARRSLDGHRS
jgi:hypothetical protein